MPATRTITITADRDGMLLIDLRTFVAEMDAAGADDSTPIGGRVTVRGRLKELTAKPVRPGDPGAET